MNIRRSILQKKTLQIQRSCYHEIFIVHYAINGQRSSHLSVTTLPQRLLSPSDLYSMKIAVTGCNGLVGRRVVICALAQGHVVLGIDYTPATKDQPSCAD